MEVEKSAGRGSQPAACQLVSPNELSPPAGLNARVDGQLWQEKGKTAEIRKIKLKADRKLQVLRIKVSNVHIVAKKMLKLGEACS